MGIDVGRANWVNDQYQETKNGTIIIFFEKEEKDAKATLESGTPKYKMVPWIIKEIPGDNLVKIERKVRDSDKDEFPALWDKFIKKQATPLEGMPLDHWAGINRAQVAEFKALGIYTIENFLDMPEGHGHKIMGFHDLRKKARAFMAASADSAALEKSQAQNDALQKQIDELKAMIANGATAQPATGKRRGRPPKA